MREKKHIKRRSQFGYRRENGVAEPNLRSTPHAAAAAISPPSPPREKRSFPGKTRFRRTPGPGAHPTREKPIRPRGDRPRIFPAIF